MHAEEGQIEEGFGDEVSIGDGVEGVVEAAGEAQVVGDAVGVEREGGAGQGAGAERRDVKAATGVHEAVHIAGEGPTVGEQVVG